MVGFKLGHPLLDRDQLYWTDLRGMAFLVTRSDPGAMIAATITARLAGPGHAPTIATQSVTRDNLHSFVKEDCLSVIAGAASFADDGMAFRQIHDAFGATRLAQSLIWRDENDNPALARFLLLTKRRYGHCG